MTKIFSSTMIAPKLRLSVCISGDFKDCPVPNQVEDGEGGSVRDGNKQK